MTLAPIVLFVYNRPEHARRTITALAENEFAKDSNLFIFADGPKPDATEEQLQRIREVRELIHHTNGFKSVSIEESPKNKGLANSIISGVTRVVNQFGRVIVLEDDIVTHRFFLRFMNETLDCYADDQRIYSIGGYNIDFPIPKHYWKDVYIVHRCESLGWATWKDRWIQADWKISDYDIFINNNRSIRNFNRGGDDMAPMLNMQMNGMIDSWAIRWDYCLYKNNAFCLRPVISLCHNIGYDETATHSSSGTDPVGHYYTQSEYLITLPHRITPSFSMQRRFKKAYQLDFNYIKRIFWSIKRRFR